MRDEPVVWSPPRLPIDEENAIGPELDDIDVERMHDLMTDSRFTVGMLSNTLHRTPAHIKLAIDKFPRSTGKRIRKVSWKCRIRLPDASLHKFWE